MIDALYTLACLTIRCGPEWACKAVVGKKIAEDRPTHHEHEPKWEIPDYMKKITMFSWGYWGWGTSTPQFVKLVDAIEESRGFKPPIFVDTRIKRQVRAPGFNGDAFEKLLGKDRYVHMKELGNRSIVTHKGFIEIADPKAANDLLDMAIQAEKKNRRIIFFCACKQPKCNGEITCH